MNETPKNDGNPGTIPEAPPTGNSVPPMETAIQPVPAATDALTSPGKARRGKKNRRVPLVLKILGFIVLVPVAAAAALFAMALVLRTDPLDALPPGFNAYVRVGSASAFFESVIDLEIADAILASPSFAPARVALRTARAQDFLRSELFRKAADVRCDAALYGASSFLAVADIGLRSVVTRLAPLVLPFFPIEGLSTEKTDGVTLFEYRTESAAIYAGVRNNLVLVSTDRALLVRALRAREGISDETRKALSAPGNRDVRVMVDPAVFASAFASGAGADSPAARLVSALEFPDLAAADASATNDAISLEIRIPLKVLDGKLEPVLSRNSKTPAALSVLPASTQYASILSAGRVSELKAAIFPYLGTGSEGDGTWKKADDGARAALGIGMDELLLSWTGDEAGVFGIEGRASPVYFIEIGDERKRKDIFEKVFSSFAVGSDDSAIAGDFRIPKISFPWYVRTVLDVAGVTAPEPYYAAERGFLFASESLDALADVVSSVRSGTLLVREERWKTVSRSVPGNSSASIYYSLDRSVPFFLRGKGAVTSALMRYGRGYATIRVEDGSVVLSLSAVASGGRGVAALPGFPVKAQGRLSPTLLARKQKGSPTPRLVWVENGKLLVSWDSASGERMEVELDGDALLASGDGDEVWAVSKYGTVYLSDARLTPEAGFPLVTGVSPSGPPLAAGGSLYLPLSDGSIFLVSRDGKTKGLGLSFDTPLLSPPSRLGETFAAYPKSFDGAVWLFDAAGTLRDGWPQPVDGIGFGSPFLLRVGSALAAGFITQAGNLFLWNADGSSFPGFPVSLEGVFSAQGMASGGSIFALSERGVAFRVSTTGESASVELKGFSAKTGFLVAADVNRDGVEEVFATGDGNALYAFTRDMKPLEGFPVPGTGIPVFADLNADGKTELVATTVDDTVAAYVFR
ncbi:MAG: VCBS repeat-containing protein [Spirochaetes bacterium]|nr:VCBS repeat-containing protein [Spirochaetota bacterium]